jgi:hypothetical protein
METRELILVGATGVSANTHRLKGSRDNADGVANRYGLDGLRFEPCRSDISPARPDRCRRPPESPVQWAPCVLPASKATIAWR